MIKFDVKTVQSYPSEFRKYTMGNLELIAVSDGLVPYDNSCFAPGITKDTISDVLLDFEPLTTHFNLPHNILIIKHNSRIIMIDSGNGYRERPHAGKLYDNLLLAGITPQSITDIILSHAHPDHINGLIDDKNKSVFSKAKIHISKQEYEFWTSKADFSRSKNTVEALHSLQAKIQYFFTIIKPQLYFFTEGDLLLDCLQPILMPGHTAGHCIFVIKSAQQEIIHLSDIFHEEVMLFAKPEWGTIFDIDFDLAATNRQDILAQFANSNKLVFGYHLPWPGFGYIEKCNKSFKWIAQDNI